MHVVQEGGKIKLVSSSCSSLKWLDSDEKRKIVEKPEAEIEQGSVDAEMIPYLRELNNLEGVCTIFSCSGHFAGDEGYIVFRVAEHLSNVVRNRVLPILALSPYITNVTDWYSKEPDGAVTCQSAIYFRPEDMKQAMDEVVKELRLALSAGRQ